MCFLKNNAVKSKIFDWLDQMMDSVDSSGLKILQSSVMEQLNILVSINSDRTANLVKVWFHDKHADIIDKFSDAPHLQLKYLKELAKNPKTME